MRRSPRRVLVYVCVSPRLLAPRNRLLAVVELLRDTDGKYGLLEVTVRKGEGSPWHVHPDEDEWFYVLEGEFTVYAGERRLSLSAGAFAFGPRGVPHTSIGETDGAKALIGFQPFHFEGFLHEVVSR